MNQGYTKAFLGPKLEHLLPLYEEGYKIRFSFAAAFWSFFWFLYRRMFLLATVVVFVFFWSNGALKAALVPQGVPCMAVEAIHLAMMAVITGFVGPWLYFMWSKWRVGMLVKRFGHLDDIKLKQILMKKGGVNLKGTLWLVLIPFILLFLLLLVNYLQEPELVKKAFLDALLVSGCEV